MKVLTCTASTQKKLVEKSLFNDSPLTGNTFEDLSVSSCKFEIHVTNYYPKALFLFGIP